MPAKMKMFDAMLAVFAKVAMLAVFAKVVSSWAIDSIFWLC